MKRKALKISSNTLFVYKSVKATGKSGVETDVTTSMTATSSLTGGIFHK